MNFGKALEALKEGKRLQEPDGMAKEYTLSFRCPISTAK